MKARADAILRPEQAAYLDRLLPPRDAILAEMEKVAAEEGIPISDPEVGRFLAILARSCGARRILEVGSAIGYGALWLARGAPEAQVVSVDRDPEMQARARAFLDRTEEGARVRFEQGEALEVLSRMLSGAEAPFDLIYIDADKPGYRRYLDVGLQLLRVGGLVVADNLLYQGLVADPAEEREEDEEAVDAISTFNGYLMSHPQLDAIVLPFGDGLGVAVKKRPLITDMGGPF